MSEKIIASSLRFTREDDAKQTRENIGAISLSRGDIDERPVASSLASSFWLTGSGALSYSDGTSWWDVATSSSGSSISAYPKIWTYQTVTTPGEEVWLRAQAKTVPGVSWSRSGTTLALVFPGSTSLSPSVGDRMVVYGATLSISALVQSVGSGFVTLTVLDTGVSSGSGVEAAVVPDYVHDATGTTKKGGVLKTPDDTQLLSLTIHTGDRDATYDGSTWTSSGYYYITLPANATGQVVNGIGGTSGVDRAIIPMVPLNAAYTQSMTRVIGAFANYDSGGTNFAKIRFEGLGSSPVILRVSF